jgi:hypothetical protein
MNNQGMICKIKMNFDKDYNDKVCGIDLSKIDKDEYSSESDINLNDLNFQDCIEG